MSRTTDLTGIEGQFCTSWEGWDDIDMGIVQFYDAELTSEFSALCGVSIADVLIVDTSTCTVQVCTGDEGDDIVEFKFRVVVDKQ